MSSTHPHHSNIHQGFVDSILDALDRATTTDAEVKARLEQAVTIAQMGGVDDATLNALLHLAACRCMTPTVTRLLREAGINPDPADAIVIERASLPRVTVRADGSVSVKVFTWSGESDPDDLREVAACYLAAAEYLAAHPPVPPVSDEDVETLTGLMGSIVNWPASSIARRLLATGRVSVTK